LAEDQALATLIGDLVASKRHADRAGLQRSLSAALRAVNRASRPLQPLELTVGDEFQGAFSKIASAARASLLLRLELLVREGGADSRYGLGYGSVTIFDGRRKPTSQDGPGWWAARAAIDRARRLSASPRTSFVRTCFEYENEGSNLAHPGGAALEAFLMCRDSTVDQMSQRQRRLLLGLMRGRTQAELAADERITQGAVSQNLRGSGALAIEAAQLRLEEAPG
jgi:SatD family (SatD)